MKIAVINSGSSSLKFKLFDMQTSEVLTTTYIEHIGEENSKIQTHHEALESLVMDFNTVDLFAHRVVHGGETLTQAVLIDTNIMQQIEELSSLAPLHNPANLEGIKAVLTKAPDIKQVAVFDTAFHSSMPEEAYLYALPYTLYKEKHIRRYGFHGTSHSYLAKVAAQELGIALDQLNVITLHLGNGASICAIENGKSIDTSMGFTPLEGLVMGTRSGDLDPAVVLYMQEELGMSTSEVKNILNRESGLLGLCGENDIREILKSSDSKADLALRIMIRRAKKYIGSYMALLGRVDSIVFSGGVGENSEYIRNEILNTPIFHDIKHLVIHTDEELEIAQQAVSLLKVID